MASKYVDPTAIMQVIGCVYNSPQLLDFTDKYSITEEDFPDQFHRVVFGAIYKIHELGAEKVTLENINDFLASRPKYQGIYKANKGEEWLLNIADTAKPLSFDYYYSRLKKMSLLRAYDNYGIDVSFIYDPDNILDVEKKQLQEDNLDNSSLENIAKLVDDRIETIKANGKEAEVTDSFTYEVKIPLNDDEMTATVLIKTKLGTDQISIDDGIYATVYYDDKAYISSILGDDGAMYLDSTVRSEIAKKVYAGETVFVDGEEINGVSYYAVFEPFYQPSTGEVCGMLFCGIPRSVLTDEIMSSAVTIIITSVVLIVIAVFIVIIILSMMIKALKKAIKDVDGVSQGYLDFEVNNKFSGFKSL